MTFVLVLVALPGLMLSLSGCGQAAGSPNVPTPTLTVNKTNIPAAPGPITGVLVIQGTFDPKGEKILELKPVRLYPRTTAATLLNQQGLYLVKVAYETKVVTTVPFDALVADDAGHTVHGFFEVEVPVSAKVDFILITDASGERTFARVNGSEILR